MLNLFYSVLAYIKTNSRSNAPHTPRVILLGPTGSGKNVQAELLASKYDLVNGKDINGELKERGVEGGQTGGRKEGGRKGKGEGPKKQRMKRTSKKGKKEWKDGGEKEGYKRKRKTSYSNSNTVT